jgi:hypothetical protein
MHVNTQTLWWSHKPAFFPQGTNPGKKEKCHHCHQESVKLESHLNQFNAVHIFMYCLQKNKHAQYVTDYRLCTCQWQRCPAVKVKLNIHVCFKTKCKLLSSSLPCSDCMLFKCDISEKSTLSKYSCLFCPNVKLEPQHLHITVTAVTFILSLYRSCNWSIMWLIFHYLSSWTLGPQKSFNDMVAPYWIATGSLYYPVSPSPPIYCPLPDNTVTHRPTAKWWLCKQWLLLGNACNIHTCNNRRMEFSVVCTVAVSGQWLSKHVPMAMDTNATMEEWCFLCDLCRDVISKGQN